MDAYKMAKKPLFTDDYARDLGYQNIRSAQSDRMREIRQHCERLWDKFERHADQEFLVEIRNDFDARYWEMYLTVTLIEMGYEVTCPKPGPDVGIKVDGQAIWFEATSPTRGADGSPDQVPELKFGEVHNVPNEKMVLRYLNSISEKYDRQYPSWLKNGHINTEDAFVVALNPRKLGFEHADTEPPRLLQAAYNLGNLFIEIDQKNLSDVRTGYHFRNAIEKTSGSKVFTGLFHRDDYSGLSGLLCSRVDAANQPEKLGADFQLAPNPNAKNALSAGFRLLGTYFGVSQDDDGLHVKPENIE